MSNPTPTIRERVLGLATQRDELLQKLAATESVSSDLTQVKLELGAVTNTFYEKDSTYGLLHDSAKREKAEWEKVTSGHLKKFFQPSKYVEKEQKEFDEYIEAQGWADKAKATRDLLQKQIDELKKRRDALEETGAERVRTQFALDNLYGSVFEGPTPDVPGEDKLEEAVRAAQEVFDEIQNRVSLAAEVVNKVSMANMSLSYAMNSASYALGQSSADINDHSNTGTAHSYSSFSSSVADFRERNALGWVSKCLVEAEYYMLLAHQIDPEVQGFSTPKVADGDSVAGLMDQFLNTPVTDYLFHREIQATIGGLREAAMIVQEELDKADVKAQALTQEKRPFEASLKESRKNLLDARSQAFEQAAGKH